MLQTLRKFMTTVAMMVVFLPPSPLVAKTKIRVKNSVDLNMVSIEADNQQKVKREFSLGASEHIFIGDYFTMFGGGQVGLTHSKYSPVVQGEIPSQFIVGGLGLGSKVHKNRFAPIVGLSESFEKVNIPFWAEDDDENITYIRKFHRYTSLYLTFPVETKKRTFGMNLNLTKSIPVKSLPDKDMLKIDFNMYFKVGKTWNAGMVYENYQAKGRLNSGFKYSAFGLSFGFFVGK